mgnify:CR=1 FL=1
MKVHMLVQKEYKPGDLPPEGYLAWHEWAEVQRKAGIKQVECGRCGRWKTPQELSGEKIVVRGKSITGKKTIKMPLCQKCISVVGG